jgi:hypothetical protein
MKRSFALSPVALLAAMAFCLASCIFPPEPPPPEMPPMPSLPVKDYGALRITGRETIAVAPDVSVHADQQSPQSDGTIALSGRVYLDGTQHNAKDHAWPLHAYADQGIWDAAHGTLTLSGEPACEFASSRIIGTSAETRMVFDGHQCQTEGPSRFQAVASPPRKKQAE